MAAARPWSDDEAATLKKLHADGLSLNAVAKAMNRSKDLVSRRAAQLGLDWDRSRTAAATQAVVIDAKARRAALQVGLLEDAEKLRGQLWTKTKAFNFGGKDNTYNEVELDQPTFGDQLKIMQATGAAIDRALKLDVHDSGAGATQVVGLLQRTAAALGLTDAVDTPDDAQ